MYRRVAQGYLVTMHNPPLPAAVVRWLQPLSETQRGVRRAAAIFSFFFHPLAKKISAKKLSYSA
jgi:hypothetical protein